MHDELNARWMIAHRFLPLVLWWLLSTAAGQAAAAPKQASAFYPGSLVKNARANAANTLGRRRSSGVSCRPPNPGSNATTSCGN